MADEDQTRLETHFRFGENWSDYARRIDAAAVREAEAGLARLIEPEQITGRTVIDIGCGSGLHALAFLNLGAQSVLAVDIDPQSAATARTVLSERAAAGRWQVAEQSVFDLGPATTGRFDIVYSWGVLHHTGDLDRAMRCAGALVGPGGLFAFALYRETSLDRLWIAEKRWYAKASPAAQARARRLYTGLYRLGLRATGRRYADHVAGYKSRRGMSFEHDVHDWLGGWPYEAVSPIAVDRQMRELGLSRVTAFTRPKSVGLLGSGCDEYVYARR